MPSPQSTVLANLENFKKRARELQTKPSSPGHYVVFGREDCPHTQRTIRHLEGYGITADFKHTPPFTQGASQHEVWQFIRTHNPVAVTVPQVFYVHDGGAQITYVGDADRTCSRPPAPSLPLPF